MHLVDTRDSESSLTSCVHMCTLRRLRCNKPDQSKPLTVMKWQAWHWWRLQFAEIRVSRIECINAIIIHVENHQYCKRKKNVTNTVRWSRARPLKNRPVGFHCSSHIIIVNKCCYVLGFMQVRSVWSLQSPLLWNDRRGELICLQDRAVLSFLSVCGVLRWHCSQSHGVCQGDCTALI